MTNLRRNFETIWCQIQREVSAGDTIRNWTQYQGYIGDEFTIRAVDIKFVEVDSPGAENLQRVPREDFVTVYQMWDDYKAEEIRRYEIRDRTRFSKYIISILHHVIDST